MGRVRMRGAGRTVRVAVVALGVAAILAAIPGVALATVLGGCTATGTSTSGGTIDLTTNAVWHVRSTDQITLAGAAPAAGTATPFFVTPR